MRDEWSMVRTDWAVFEFAYSPTQSVAPFIGDIHHSPLTRYRRKGPYTTLFLQGVTKK